MKRKLVCLIAIIYFCLPCFANAAFIKDYKTEFINPNGDKVSVYTTGDEYFRYTHDKNGNVLVLNEKGYYTYATLNGGKVVPSNVVYDGKIIPKNVIKRKDINLDLNKNLVHSFKNNTTPSVLNSVSRSQREGTGEDVVNYNNIIIFVKFSGDSEFVDSSLINSLSNALGSSNSDYTGLKSYVNKVTEGHINTNAILLQNNGSNYYSYTSGYKRGYLEPYSSSNTIGYSNENEGYERLHKIFNSAIQSLPATSKDNLDANGDGIVDNIIFFVKGYSSSNWGDVLWPHKFNLGAFITPTLVNGLKPNTYNLQFAGNGDFSNSISVLSHETMHSLGIPDLYRYSYSGDPVGKWDMMNIDQEGTYISSYIRNKYGIAAQGNKWTTESTMIEKSGEYTLTLASSNSGVTSYMIPTGNSGQYILLEYRGNNGIDVYDRKVPGKGLIVSRIDVNGSNGNRGTASGSSYIDNDEYYIYRPGEPYSYNGKGGGGYIDNAAIVPCETKDSCSNGIGNKNTYDTLDDYVLTNKNNSNTKIVIKNVYKSGEDKISFYVFTKDDNVLLDKTNYTGTVNTTFKINPIFVSSTYSVTYSSEDESIATVDANGNVSLVGVGSTRIRAYINSKYYYTNVNVLPGKISNLRTSLTDPYHITLNYDFNGYKDRYVIYKSTDGVNFYEAGKTTSLSYIDNVTFGYTYFYKVGIEYNGQTTVSDEVVSVNTLTYLPTKVSGVTSDVRGVDKAFLRFDRVSDADGYNIYVSNNVIGPYEYYDSTLNTDNDISVQAARNYYIKVAAYKTYNGSKFEGELSDYTYFNTREQLLSPPTITSVNAVNNDSIKIIFDSVDGATGYNLYVSEDNKNYKLLAGNIKENEYIHNNTVFGKTYYYKVSAISDNKYNGFKSNEYKFLFNKITPFNFKVTSKNYNSIDISYDKINNATGYEIYYSTSKTGIYKKLATTTSTTYTHKSLTFNKAYFYKVRSYFKNGSSNIYSNYTEIKSAKPLTEKPKVNIEQLDDGQIKVNYGKVSNADSYKIYKYDSENNSYTLLTTTKSLSYSIKNLTMGNEVQLKVVSYKGSVKGNETVIKHLVTLKKPTIKISGTTLTITSVKNATYYRVYKELNKGREFLFETTELVNVNPEFVSSEITKYYVIAHNESLESGKSNVVTNISSMNNPTFKAVSSDYSTVNINVTADREYEGYNLYMSTKSNGTYTKVASSKTTEFKYNSVKVGTTYYFKVAAFIKVDGKEVIGKYSPVVTYKHALNKIDSVKLQNLSPTSVKVTFDKVTKASGYQVSFRVGESGSFTTVNLKTNSFTHSGLTFGTDVYYKVRSYYKSGTTTTYSAYSSLYKINVKSAKVKYTLRQITDSSIEINITKNKDCIYTVYYGLSEDNLDKSHSSAESLIVLDELEKDKTYYIKVTEIYNGVESDLYDIVSRKVSSLVPSNFRYEQVNTKKINLYWDNVGSSSKYELYLEDNLIYSGNHTDYVEDSLIPGKEYNYQVRSYVETINGKIYSDYSNLKVRTLPEKVSGISAVPVSTLKAFNVSFSEVSDASYYKLLVSTSSNGTYSEKQRVSTNKFTNIAGTPGKTYYYKIQSCITFRGKDYCQAATDVKSIKLVPLKVENAKAVSVNHDTGKVTWNKVSGASGYELYYSTSSNGKYTKIATTTANSYTHKKLTVGKTYYYKVRAYKTISSKKYYGAYSSVVNAKIVPAKMGKITVKRKDYSAYKNTISWTKVSGISGYEVYRSYDNVTFTKLGTSTGATYTDSTDNVSKKYYKVRMYKTVSGKKVYGAYSDVQYMNAPNTPSLSTVNLSTSYSNTSTILFMLTNKGSKTIRILSSGAYSYDADYSSFNRSMKLIDSNIKEISKLDISAGASDYVRFKYSSPTWYDKYTKMRVYFLYDGVKYTLYTSYYYGNKLYYFS